MSRFNPVKSKTAYKVLRHIIKEEEGSYGSEISDRENITQGQASDNIRELREEDIISRGKRGKAQYYIPNWAQIRFIQQEILSADTKLKQEFLEKYCKKYCRFNSSSTIQEMLGNDFVTIFSSYIHSKPDKEHQILRYVNNLDKKNEFDKKFYEIAESLIESEE